MQLIFAIYFKLYLWIFHVIHTVHVLTINISSNIEPCDTPFTKHTSSFSYSCSGDCLHWPLPLYLCVCVCVCVYIYIYIYIFWSESFNFTYFFKPCNSLGIIKRFLSVLHAWIAFSCWTFSNFMFFIPYMFSQKYIIQRKHSKIHHLSQVRGFKPGRSRRVFQRKNILSTPSFGRELKPFVPCRRSTACKRSLNVTWKSQLSVEITGRFSSK